MTESWHHDSAGMVVTADGRDEWGLPALRVETRGSRTLIVSMTSGLVVDPADPLMRRLGLVAVFMAPVVPYELIFHDARLHQGSWVIASTDPQAGHRDEVLLFTPHSRRPLGLVPSDAARWLVPRLRTGEEISGVCLSVSAPDHSEGATLLLGARRDLEAMVA